MNKMNKKQGHGWTFYGLMLFIISIVVLNIVNYFV